LIPVADECRWPRLEKLIACQPDHHSLVVVAACAALDLVVVGKRLIFGHGIGVLAVFAAVVSHHCLLSRYMVTAIAP
jgi:hypothetical protein